MHMAKNDKYWSAFEKTGDISFYLLYKENQRNKIKTENDIEEF